jgi:hypothetical protein
MSIRKIQEDPLLLGGFIFGVLQEKIHSQFIIALKGHTLYIYDETRLTRYESNAKIFDGRLKASIFLKNRIGTTFEGQQIPDGGWAEFFRIRES